MNKNLKKFTVIALSLALALSMIACSGDADDASDGGAASYDAGTYEATADGYGGDVKVEVEFSESKITSVKVVEHEETDGIGTEAVDQMPQAIVDAQSLGVDATSGATVTSDAILEAVADAVNQAGGDADSLK